MITLYSGGGKKRDLVEDVSLFFSETGALSASPDFEYRPEQQRMAVAVARALEQGTQLVAEAGTGTGKSLAYLVPAVLYSLRADRKAVISTHTINLQEQLINKDLPILQKLLDEPFSAVLLKGRGNYLCPNRLRRAMEGTGDLFSSSEEEELEQIWEWSHHTKDGTKSDLGFTPKASVWAQVCSESHVCNPKICGTGDRCFYQDARRRSGEADVVVLNHTLFFTMLPDEDLFAEDGDGILFARDFVIFDEAHTLETVAARQLGMRLSQSGLRFDLQRLYNPRSRKGLFQLVKESSGVRSTAALLDEVDSFFEELGNVVEFRGPGREFRVREPELVENTLSAGLFEVAKATLIAAEKATKDSVKMELQDLGRRISAARAGLADFLDLSQEDHVYWVERGGLAGQPQLSLQSAPVDVASRLRDILFKDGVRSILTSATLAVGDPNLGYFRQRVGGENAEAVQIGSPFDYNTQMEIKLVQDMPEPRAEGYEDALARWIAHFLVESDGRAFVLFTSYALLQRMAERLEDFCFDHGWTLLAQGQGKQRHHLIEEFKEDIPSVLFGTDSFWTGVDVPGEALSNVMITRLPFAVPDHPLIASRLEEIQARGGNSFMEYSVPEAILKLRQGVGRLIRSGRDEGIAVILDSRVMTKRYGGDFLEALPNAPRQVLRIGDCSVGDSEV